MHQQGKDEPNASSSMAASGQPACYQTIAKLAETTKNYLAQPGVELRSPNTSSDLQASCQDVDKKALQTSQEALPLPPDSTNANERELFSSRAALIENPVKSDREDEPMASALMQSQVMVDPESFQTAPGHENVSGQNDIKRNQLMTTTIQSLQSANEVVNENIVPAAFTDVPMVTEAAPESVLPLAIGAQQQALEAHIQDEPMAFEKVEISAFADCVLEISDEKVSAPLQNDLDDHPITLEEDAFQSQQPESNAVQQNPAPDEQDQSPAQDAAEAQPMGRAVRSCVKNTPNYSHTHKGITTSQIPKNVSSFEAVSKDQAPVEEGKEQDVAATQPIVYLKDERKVASADNKARLNGKRTYEDICASYENMFAFDWDLRDINNMRHPPDREVTPIVVWFYINILYFPYNAQDLAKVSFEEFARPILESLARTSLQIGDDDGQQLPPPNAEPKLQSAEELSLQGSQPDRQDGAENQRQAEAQGNAMSQASLALRLGEDLNMLNQLRGAAGVGPLGDFDLPELIQKLQIEENFKEFKDLFLSQMYKVKEIREGDCLPEESDFLREAGITRQLKLPVSKELSDIEDDSEDYIFDYLLAYCQSLLDKLSTHNKTELKKQYNRFQDAYQAAEEKATMIIEGKQDLVPRPSHPYNPTKLAEYGLDFLSFVDPYFVADIKENFEWYLQNQNEVLLNVSYPSKQEKEFLRHIEQWQQEKNDLNYKRILQQLAEGADDPNSQGPNGLNIQRYNSLSAHKRGLVVQEDAQCAICNNGDYEDEDLIVFCGACNIPVHQRCYGIDEIPDNDWICNNCWAFNMRRGIMVKCLLCPKRGGAMKPTSIFRTQEQYMRYHQAALKKKGLHHLTYFPNKESPCKHSQEDNAQLALTYQAAENNQNLNSQQSAEQKQSDSAAGNQAQTQETALALGKQSSTHRSQRLHFFEREDKNHALSQILNREGGYQEQMANQKRENGENFSQNNVDLHFLESESIAEIPEDYTFFLQRNEQRLESNETVPTDTLYEWVHLSCAMWIPGPTVTPKTPVRMSKIDTKRFDLQCIICGKRNGACIQCQHSRCMISFHIECARRANYFLEVERVDRERNYRVFCEKHRPLKIVREMEEKDKQTLEEVQKFSKLIDRCMDTYTRAESKQIKQKRVQPFSKPPVPQQPSRREIQAAERQQKRDIDRKKKQERENELIAKREQQRLKKEEEKKEKEIQRKLKQEQAQMEAQKKAEKQAKEKQQQQQQQSQRLQSVPRVVEPAPPAVIRWRDKDRKVLFERIRDRFLQLMKLRINVQRVDPMIKIKKRQEILAKKNEKEQRRIEKKRREKQFKKAATMQVKRLQQSGQRSGLRSRQSTMGVNEANAIGAEPSADLNTSALAGDLSMSNHIHSAKSMNQQQQMTLDGNIASVVQDNLNQEDGENGAINRPQDDFFRINSELNQQDLNKCEDSAERQSDEEHAEPQRRPTIEELVMPEHTEPFFKFATPTFVQELDWAVTFSKYDFPWHEIKFDQFSARECYKKYTKEIRDAQTFFKKVLGGKEKYKKNIAGQLEDAQQIFFSALPSEPSKGADSAKVALQDAKEQAADNQAHETEDIEHFCKCRGEFNSLTGYFVMCENESACPNGGWLHPECTRDLCKMSQEDISKIDKWYCEDCVDARNNMPIKRLKPGPKPASGARDNSKRSKKKSGSKKRSKPVSTDPNEKSEIQTPSETPKNQKQRSTSNTTLTFFAKPQPQIQKPQQTEIPQPQPQPQQPQAQPVIQQTQPQLVSTNLSKPGLLASTFNLTTSQASLLPLNQPQKQQQQPQAVTKPTFNGIPLPTLPITSLSPQNQQPLSQQSNLANPSNLTQPQAAPQQSSLHSQLQVNHAFQQFQQQQQQNQQQSASLQPQLTQKPTTSANQSLMSLLAQQKSKEVGQAAGQRTGIGPTAQATLSQQLESILNNQRSSASVVPSASHFPQISALTLPHSLQRSQQTQQSPAAQFSLSPGIATQLQQQSQLSSQLPLLLGQPQSTSNSRQNPETPTLLQPTPQSSALTQPQQLQSSSKVILNFGSKLSSLPKFTTGNGNQNGQNPK